MILSHIDVSLSLSLSLSLKINKNISSGEDLKKRPGIVTPAINANSLLRVLQELASGK